MYKTEQQQDKSIIKTQSKSNIQPIDPLSVNYLPEFAIY